MNSNSAPRISFYGRSALLRKYCCDCKTTSFVLDGYYQCCDKPDEKKEIKYMTERISECFRGSLAAEFKRKILALQKHRCHYCGLDLSRVWYYIDKYGCAREIRVNFDHFIPASYCANESLENIYAVCNICNRYKSSKIFNSIGELRKYLQETKKIKEIMIYSSKQVDQLYG